MRPYYAVIFASSRPADAGDDGYAEAAARLADLAADMPGFLGMHSARNPDGSGITVCYWESEAAIAAWRTHAEHREAQQHGRAGWYERFDLRIAVVTRESSSLAPPAE